MTTFKCSCCQGDFDYDDLVHKIAILDKHIFEELSMKAQDIMTTHDIGNDYIMIYINLSKDEVELHNICEKCEHDDLFKYTDKLFEDYFTMLEVKNESKYIEKDLTVVGDINLNECYLCHKELKNSNDRFQSLYLTEELIHDIKKNPKMLQRLSFDDIFGLVSQNTKLIVSCESCHKDKVLPNLEFIKESIGLELIEETSENTYFEEERNTMKSNPFKNNTKNQVDTKKRSLLEELGENLLSESNIKKIRENKIFGRDKEVDTIINIISKRDKNNPIIIGESGVGKTSTVHKLCLRIADKDVPSDMLDKKIYEIKVSSLIAGTRYRGDLEEKLTVLLKEIKERDDVIIFIDEIHQVLGASENTVEGNGIADILKPALSKGEITCIGISTIDEYKKTIERNASLNRRFQTVMLKEPSEEDTLDLLRKLKGKYEKHHAITISDSILEETVRLSARYVTDRLLPDKALDLIDQAGALLKVEEDTVAIKHYINRNKKMLKKIQEKEFETKEEKEENIKELRKINSELQKVVKLDIKYIQNVINDWTGIDVAKIQNDSVSKLTNLDEVLKSEVIGQEQATDVVARYIQRAKVGLHNPNKPLGVSLLIGPTGTGKTELAKVVNNILNGNNEVIRFDLSEFAEKHEYSKLIGAPSGYTGYDEGGLLTDKVKRNPNAVILFDEIEKAHPNIFNLFLQIFDEGYLTDSRGERVDFRNTMIFLTSNLIVNSNEITYKSIGFSSQDKSKEAESTDILDALKEKGLKPEFLNRIDEILLFNELSEETIHKISNKKLNEKMLEVSKHNQYIKDCTYDAKVVDFIVEHGYQRDFGARPINRAIEKYISSSLTDFLIKENVFNRKRKINCKITIKDNQVIVSKN